MTSFVNPRLAAIACERMRGVLFAENFVTELYMGYNKGTLNGTGNTVLRGYTTDGNGYADYEQIPCQDCSITIKFSAAAAMAAGAEGVLFGTANLSQGALGDGVCVWADADGVKATVATGAAIETALEVDFDYADGFDHWVTYVVDMTGGNHYLYVDGEDTATAAITISAEVGNTTAAMVAGDGTDNFIGTINKVIMFSVALDEEEHDNYVNEDLTSFMDEPWGKWRCDSAHDDTDGNMIWDSSHDHRDITKADGSTSANFPTLGTTGYTFDGVNDYVDVPTLPTVSTVTAAVTEGTYPAMDDETLLTDIEVSGDWTGVLHSLAIYDHTLTTLQGNHDEYRHMFHLDRGLAVGFNHRTITEGLCQQWADYTDGYTDYSKNGSTQTAKNGTTQGASGIAFPNANSHVEIADAAALRFSDITISLYGTFTGSEVAGGLVTKGTNYVFSTNGNQLVFNGATIAHTFSNNTHLAVAARDGFKPRFFVDGEYIGEGSSTVTVDDSGTAVVIIGNVVALNAPSQYTFKQMFLGNFPVTDEEMKAMFYQAVQADV